MDEQAQKFIKDLLKSWWDYMDEDQTANRKEYTEEEQNELLDDFIKLMRNGRV